VQVSPPNAGGEGGGEGDGVERSANRQEGDCVEQRMPSRYEDAAEKTLHRLQDWGAPATRRTMPIQPSWLHRDPNAMADRIQRDATTKGARIPSPCEW
jgi:hypothetical protein